MRPVLEPGWTLYRDLDLDLDLVLELVLDLVLELVSRLVYIQFYIYIGSYGRLTGISLN